MRVLVTGGAGFVGSHIVDSLITKGHDPVVLDDLSSGVNHVDGKCELIRHRLGEGGNSLLQALILQARPDAIIHAAAYADLRRNWADKTGFFERQKLTNANLFATQALLEAMPDVPLVFISTASVYGAQRTVVPVTVPAAVPMRSESPYAASKLACEAYVFAYSHARNFPAKVCRLVNVVGARTEHGVIGDFVRMMQTTGAIHAADDGTQRKSWVHVSDVAESVVLLATATTFPDLTVNLTSEERISWWDIVDEMGVDRTTVTFEARDRGAIGDPHDLHVDGMGWTCDTPVRQGIQEALDWLGWKK